MSNGCYATTDNSDLRHCPHCGAAAVFYVSWTYEFKGKARIPALDGSEIRGRVKCNDCQAQTATLTEPDAKASWNRRCSPTDASMGQIVDYFNKAFGLSYTADDLRWETHQGDQTAIAFIRGWEAAMSTEMKQTEAR